MRRRCEDASAKSYSHYGARGIRVCERWRDFANFIADMGPRPTAKHSIDRIDNDGNYEPGNCRWATSEEQARNRSDNVLLTLDGETLCLSDWSAKLQLHPKTLSDRLANGWSVRRALTKPPHKEKRNAAAS